MHNQPPNTHPPMNSTDTNTDHVGPLVRRKDPSGARDYLCGQPVTCGQPPLELFTGDVEAGRQWALVRYEAALFRHGPAIVIDDAGEHETSPRDRFRWPLRGTGLAAARAGGADRPAADGRQR